MRAVRNCSAWWRICNGDGRPRPRSDTRTISHNVSYVKSGFETKRQPGDSPALVPADRGSGTLSFRVLWLSPPLGGFFALCLDCGSEAFKPVRQHRLFDGQWRYQLDDIFFRATEFDDQSQFERSL